MRTHVETCHGGVAVVVPEPLASQVGLRVGSTAEVEVTNGKLVVRVANPPTLNDLLAAITPENRHGEWATGPSVGAELL
jgi:antitoxin component of MazEF toxin-antitoxin module